MQRGFTMLETIIYLALFAMIMSGALVSAYGLIGSGARNQTKALVQEEGTFLLGKIDWALTGVKTINLPVVGSPGNTISVTKFDSSVGNPIVISISGSTMTITRGGNPIQALNNSNVAVTCAPAGCFSHSASTASGINPESVSAAFTITAKTAEGLTFSQDFSTIKFLRK
jgi:prepilin-type N-terminal cleavage/methylation domain-containing protein